MVVSKARCGCLLGRSQSRLVKSCNASSRVAMVGVPVERSRLKIAAPLSSFGGGRRSVKNLSTTTTTTTVVVRAGELEDSIYNINFDYLTKDIGWIHKFSSLLIPSRSLGSISWLPAQLLWRRHGAERCKLRETVQGIITVGLGFSLWHLSSSP